MIHRGFNKILFISIFAFSLITSCEKKEAYHYFLIKVDSVQVSQNPVANTPFDISFFGFIGGNGCFSFDQFVINQDNLVLEIEAWGKSDARATKCPTVNVYLTGHTLTHSVSIPGTYNLKIKLPDNKFLEKQIIIK